MAKSKLLKIIIIIIVIILIVHISISISISTHTHLNELSKQIMIDATEDKGVLPEKYQGIVSEENYKYLDMIPSYWYSDYKDSISKAGCSFDSAHTKLYWGKAETTCRYSYYLNDANSKISYDEYDVAIIYYKFENGKWIIDDFSVLP